MKKFTLGVLAGMSTLTLAVPLVAQVAGAASTGASSTRKTHTFTPPTQACLQAMVGLEEAHLANFDAESAKRKQMMETHLADMKTVAAIADDAARQTALQKLHDQLKADHPTQDDIPAAIKTAMDAVKTACGNTMMGFHGMDEGMMFGEHMDRPGEGGHMRQHHFQGATQGATSTSSAQ